MEEQLYCCRQYPTGPRYVEIRASDVEPGMKVYVARRDASKQTFFVEVQPDALGAGDTVPMQSVVHEHASPHYGDGGGEGGGGAYAEGGYDSLEPFANDEAMGADSAMTRDVYADAAADGTVVPMRCSAAERVSLTMLLLAQVFALTGIAGLYYAYPLFMIQCALTTKVLSFKFKKTFAPNLTRVAIVLGACATVAAFAVFLYMMILSLIISERPSDASPLTGNRMWTMYYVLGMPLLALGMTWIVVSTAALWRMRNYVVASLRYEETHVFLEHPEEEKIRRLLNPYQLYRYTLLKRVFVCNLILSMVCVNSWYFAWPLGGLWTAYVMYRVAHETYLSVPERTVTCLVAAIHSLALVLGGTAVYYFTMVEQNASYGSDGILAYSFSCAAVYPSWLGYMILSSVMILRARKAVVEEARTADESHHVAAGPTRRYGSYGTVQRSYYG